MQDSGKSARAMNKSEIAVIRRQAMFRVILKLNNKVVKELKIDQKKIIIGRDTTSDIQIDNIAVSREHAMIIKGPNYYFIEDMHSKNGTFVNGKIITKKFLKIDDEILIGKHSLQIILEEAPAIKEKKNVKGIDSTYRMGAAEYKRIING
jgi:pSer/pThr/pTyr-binding forkhead associated (FHA) protein